MTFSIFKDTNFIVMLKTLKCEGEISTSVLVVTEILYGSRLLDFFHLFSSVSIKFCYTEEVKKLFWSHS